MTDNEAATPIFTIEVPNPIFEGRNRVYVIPSEPVTLIDTGIATDRAFAALVEGLQKHGLAPKDIGRILLTHKHIDHIGNAWRIQQESDAEILIHESEVKSVTDVDPDGGRFRELVRQRYAAWSVPAEAFPTQDRASAPRWDIESASATGFTDGERIELSDGALEVVHTPGHTNGSCCFLYGDQLLTGDHVLPDISPNIGGGDLRSRGMLKAFLSSLQKIIEMASSIEIAHPGHGNSFASLQSRCDQLTRHHHRRLEQVIGILEKRGVLDTYSMARALYGDLKDIHIMLGCAEAEAHLEFLVSDQRVMASDGEYQLA